MTGNRQWRHAVTAGALAIAGGLGMTARAEPRTFGFEAAAELAAWEVTGDVTVDEETTRDDTGASLRIAPGAKAVFNLRDEDGAGKLDVWVFDNMTRPTDPKGRHVGPRWGLMQEDGRVLAIGILHAPYLSGDSTYTATEYDGQTWFDVQYLGECRRTMGWHRWTFDMDPDKGLSIAMDGKDINAANKRFDWNRTEFQGFTSVVFLGDEAKTRMQTFWVDDVTVEAAGPMKVKPVPPPPPPSVVPEEDPPLEGPPATLRDGVTGVHPRLLFGPGDVAALRTFAQSEAGKPFMDSLLKYLPSCATPDKPGFLRDATDGQRQGLWRLPTLALHTVLTGERASFDETVKFMKFLLDQPHWETGEELDSGMSAANIMIGAALAYDWLYADLEPAFREAYRRKLLRQARAMYYGGHLARNPGTHYWQGDPQNNHRWHRNAGLSLCALAAASGAPEEQWVLAKLREELDYVAQWLPDDGTSHESPGYMIFGGPHLLLAMQAADRCLGTDYLALPFFRNAAPFLAQMYTPGLADRFAYGDMGGVKVGALGYDAFLYKLTALSRQANEQNALDTVVFRHGVEWGWMGLLWCDPTVRGGDYRKLPTRAVFPDLGLACMRESWGEGTAAALFKCGPFGGRTLNAFRNANDAKYVNVAHDDPDANSFLLYTKGVFLAETDRYSERKQSANHNTILVNRAGQNSEGRPEGGTFSQPGGRDMLKMGYLTAWQADDNVVFVEGEAAGSYPALSDRRRKIQRPALDRFRRSFVWMDRAYVLVLDDVRAPVDVDLTWLMQGPQVTVVDAEQGRFRLATGAAACDFTLLCETEMDAMVFPSPADNRGKKLGWRQLRGEVRGASVRFASLYSLWGGNLSLAVDNWAPGLAMIRVQGEGIDDRWTWTEAPDAVTPTDLRLKRADGSERKFGPESRVKQ